MSYKPDRGDVVFVDFDPATGMEINKRRPALVVTLESFNTGTNFVWVVPISSVSRGNLFEVALPHAMKVQGVCVTQQLTRLDYRSRKIQFIEKAPIAVTHTVLNKLRAILK